VTTNVRYRGSAGSLDPRAREVQERAERTKHVRWKKGRARACLEFFLTPAVEAGSAAIDRWVHPDEVRWLREQGEALGFGSVFAGPLVRSSYRADEQRHAAETGRGAVAY